MNAAFFDLDGTLWAVSVEKSFAGYLSKIGVLRKSQLTAVLWNYLRYETGMISDHDIFKKAAIRNLFRQIDVKYIQDIYNIYFEEQLKPRFFPDMIKRIEHHRKSGDLIILISASLAFMTKKAAQYIQADASFGTELSVIDGKYTGEVSGRIHYAENKVMTIKEYAQEHSLDLSLCYAYGDRFEDRYMLGLVGHPVAVNAGRKLSNFADNMNWERIRVSVASKYE